MKRSARYALRRFRQLHSVFANGPEIVAAIMTRSERLVFETRSGLTITVPNVAGARFPAFEIHGDDVYRLRELLRELPENFVALDVGAHVGNFSLALANAAPGAVVHAFEASPSTAGWLSVNVEENDLAAQVTPYVIAVSGGRGELTFIDNARGSAHNGLTAPRGTGDLVTVPCLGFGDVLETVGGHIDLVKMDAEGAEFEIIMNSTPADWSTVRAVVMEYHPLPSGRWSDIVEYFAAVGLHLVLDRPIAPALGTAWFRRTQ